MTEKIDISTVQAIKGMIFLGGAGMLIGAYNSDISVVEFFFIFFSAGILFRALEIFIKTIPNNITRSLIWFFLYSLFILFIYSRYFC
jgi:hypothetical protein